MSNSKNDFGWWGSLRLRAKLISAFLFFAAIIALSGASGLYFVIEVGGTVEVLTNVSTPLSEETMRLTSRINQVRSVWETATGEEDAARLTAQAGLVEDLDGQTAAGVERLRGLALAGNISLDIDRAELLRTQYIQQTTDLIANHGVELRTAATTGERRAQFDSTYSELLTLLTDLARQGEDNMNQSEDATKTFVQSGRATVADLDGMLQETFNQSYPVLRDTYTVMRYLTAVQAAMQSFAAENSIERLDAIEKALAASFRRTKSRLKRLQRRITDGSAGENMTKLTKGVDTLKATLFDDDGLLAARRNLLDANMRASTMKANIANAGEAIETLLLTFTEATRVLNEGVKADTNKGVVRSQSVIGFIVVGGIFVALVFGFFFARGITLPVNRLTDAMRALADGDNDVEIPATDGKDEIGDMARAVLVFKDNAIEKERLDAEQAQARAAKEEEANRLIRLCEQFDKTATDSLRAVSSSSTEMQATAQQMSATAEETSRQSANVASASEQATNNVQTVAATAEELSASISEIGRQVMQSARIAQNAVEEADATNETVKGLVNASAKIGEVVNLINDIAGQTNLLALNATIEAARAGEAGKGFAVVAQEVKNLANQTAKATEEISAQIGAVQAETNDAVTAIEKIRGIIGEVNDIATTISSAVEEQGVSTQEIARNVQQAAKGTQDVNDNIESVSKAAGETGTASGQVLNAAQGVSRQAEGLRGEVEKFLREIRAA